MTSLHLTSLLFLILITLNLISCFNFDTSFPIIYADEKNSQRPTYFGYSVILYEGNYDSQPWIQIGAPRANHTLYEFKEPGVVYRCPIMDDCKLFPVDPYVKRNSYGQTTTGEYMALKDGAWIGVTMDINSHARRVVTCGHRWINERKASNFQDRYIEGACYWSGIHGNETEALLPLVSRDYNVYKGTVYNFAMGQAGMALHFPVMEKPELILGAPGVFNWKGSTLIYRDGSKIPSAANKRSTGPESFSELIIPDISQTTETYSFGLFGYSVSSGYFFSRNKLLYVAGAPRSSSYRGQILIFNFPSENQGKLEVKQTRQGTMMGEYFGAAIGVADINGDNLDDLIIGAPHFSSSIDEGRVYVFLGNSRGNLLLPDQSAVIEGLMPKGQFGSAIQSLGDIDLDGFADVVISAPYEEDNRGAIYIFNGGPKGLSLEPSQRITASQLFNGLRGFGVSFSRPTDIDGNRFDDLAVGSYLSGHAVVLRTSPVVKLLMSVHTSETRLESQTTNFTIGVCMSYKGSFLPSSLAVNRSLTIDPVHNRAYLVENLQESTTYHHIINISEATLNCNNLTFGIKNEKAKSLEPIEIIFSQKLVERKKRLRPLIYNRGKKPQDPFCKQCPVVHALISERELKIEVPYALKCGDDNICESDLKAFSRFVGLSSENKFVIGSKKSLQLEVIISNSQEPAYLTQAEIFLPENIHLSEIPPICNEGNENNTLVVVCDVDNPLSTNEQKKITLNLDMTEIQNSKQVGKVLEFSIVAKSKSDREINAIDNTFSLDLHLVVEADITIIGNSENYFYGNHSLTNATHLYEVQKSGASPLNEILLSVTIPVGIKRQKSTLNFLQIHEPIGFQGGQPFSCLWDDPYFIDEENIEEENPDSLIAQSNAKETRTKREIVKVLPKTNNTMNLPPSNRTAFLNCSTENIICKTVSCIVGPFRRSINVARLQIKMVLNVTVLKNHVLGQKDIIYLTTDGYVKEIEGRRTDSVQVSSTFIVEPPVPQVDSWIIILSVIAGVLILLLIIMGLIKAGFFERKQKAELEALKQAEVEQEFENVREPSTECVSEDEVQ